MSLKLILLIAAIQVVAGILAKRKKKQQAEAARGNDVDRKRSEAARRAEAARQAESRSRTSYDEDGADDEEEWEEHHLRGETRGTPAAKPSGAETRKPQSTGDLLTQLAKELGLQLPIPTTGTPTPEPEPRSAPPAPKPAPKPIQPAQKSATQSAAARPTATAQRVADAAKRPERQASRNLSSESSRTIREGGESAPRRAPSNVPVTQAAPVRAAYDPALEGLRDPEALRRAFILKTILDKPLSMQPRRPGEV
jgi:hypothetical protein